MKVLNKYEEIILSDVLLKKLINLKYETISREKHININENELCN